MSDVLEQGFRTMVLLEQAEHGTHPCRCEDEVAFRKKPTGHDGRASAKDNHVIKKHVIIYISILNRCGEIRQFQPIVIRIVAVNENVQSFN